MDPLSLLASIAGVATAGIALSRAIYDLISSIRGAPSEVSDVARGISDLSLILRELRRVIKDSRELYTKSLLRRVKSAVRRVQTIHETIREWIGDDEVERFARIRWLFRRSKTMHLLYQIESHKTGINMILQIMILAVQTRRVSMQQTSDSSRKDEDDDEKAEKAVLREQAENLVQVSYRAVRDVVVEQGSDGGMAEDGAAGNGFPDQVADPGQQIQLWKPKADDSTTWLCELVFSPSNNSEDLSDPDPAATPRTSGTDPDLGELVAASERHQELQVLLQKHPASSSVVDELLAEWTTLTEDEIEDTTSTRIPPPRTDGKTRTRAEMEWLREHDPIRFKEVLRLERTRAEDLWREEWLREFHSIRFKDALGREFRFPFELVKTWQGMEDMIQQTFVSVESLKPWEELIRPGVSIMMRMKPLPPDISSQLSQAWTGKPPNGPKGSTEFRQKKKGDKLSGIVDYLYVVGDILGRK